MLVNRNKPPFDNAELRRAIALTLDRKAFLDILTQGKGDIGAQTHRVLQSLQAVLEGAGSGLDRVVKTTVFMTDLGEFAAMNEVYATYFTSEPPARSTVQVAALPAGARVEIEAIALGGQASA